MGSVIGALGNPEAVAHLGAFAGPRVGFVLGSGWGHFIESTEVVAACPYEEIPGFGESTVAGHAGRLVRGRSAGVEYLAMQGRLHHYEGHSLERIAGTIAVLYGLGVRELVVTCAAGGVNPAYRVGDLVLIHDYVNFMLKSPVRGAVDALNAFTLPSARLVRMAEDAAEAAAIPLRKGVLFSSKGPTYETPAEVRMARQLGADVVSMSTAPELIAAASLGMEAVAFSCVTNMAPGVVPGREVNHEEVIEVMEARKGRFSELLSAVLARFDAGRVAGGDRG
ncbi:MAG: purine nucleoside phosphorylase 1 [Gemmatimonadota bacterium]|nr:MAG: purine nucleoside phosphorylase 1 [Gemmatimonadota bacterium]